MTDGKAMQIAGAIKSKAPKPDMPGGILPRHMAMGSWKADLSMGGKFRPKGAKKS
jgi:hypothetical protein